MKMKGFLKRAMGVGLAVFMTAGPLTMYANASDADSDSVKEGTYSYTSNEGNNIQREDSYIYRDDCFTRSSFLGCEHLCLLSAQASIASASRYGDEEDKYFQDYTDNGRNIENMLTDMGFEDVASNKYYHTEKLENSAAVAVGHRKITADGKDYTLLAIIPRSAGYKQEWVGNFTVGEGMMHKGFKAARDEDLRFVKQYMEENGISGDLKIWTTGHSRGAAAANLIGAFFAGGGIDYFGENVSVTPEDVYCYTFATPATVFKDVSKSEALSVEGTRGGEYADKDTPGEAYQYTGEGTINVTGDEYKCIRNYPFEYDFITLLPPSAWGYTYFGGVYPMDYDGEVSQASMLEELAVINQFAYNASMDDGMPGDFREKTFDVLNMQITPLEGGASGEEALTYYVRERISGLVHTAETVEEYENNGLGDALRSLAGVYGLVLEVFGADLFESASPFAATGIYSYLAFASERLQEEGRAANDGEATTIVLTDLLGFITGAELDPDELTVDETVVLAAKFIADNEKTPLVQTLLTKAAGVVPDDYSGLALEMFSVFLPEEKAESTKLEDVLFELIKACAYGPDPTSECAKNEMYESSAEIRYTIYELLPLLLGNKVPGLSEMIGEGGSGSVKELVTGLLPLLLKTKDSEGEEIVFADLAEAADARFIKLVDDMMAVKKKEIADNDLYDEQYVADLDRHIAGVKANISMLRRALMNIAFFDDAETYDTERNINIAATFTSLVKATPPAHYNEVFVAWARAADKANVLDHNDEEPPTEPTTDPTETQTEPTTAPPTDPTTEAPADPTTEAPTDRATEIPADPTTVTSANNTETTTTAAGTPTGSKTPGNGSNSGLSDQTVRKVSAGPVSKASSAETGDNSSILVWSIAGIAACAVAVIAVVLKRRGKGKLD